MLCYFVAYNVTVFIVNFVRVSAVLNVALAIRYERAVLVYGIFR